MSRRFLKGSICLSKLVSVITERKGQNGMVKGIFIPFDNNYMDVKDDACYLNITVGLNDEPDKYDNIAFVAHNASSKAYKAASEEEKEQIKKLPYLGNLKDFDMQSSADDSAPVVDADGDLPF